MKNAYVPRFRPRLQQLEGREVPAFLAPITSPGGGDGITVGDLNLDNFDDVAVLNGNRVVVSLGNGDGTFRPLATFTKAKGSLIRVEIRDVNADGKPDLIAYGSGSPLSAWITECPVNQGGGSGVCTRSRWYTVCVNTWLGNGNGTFGPLTTTSSSEKFYSAPAVYNPDPVRADFNRNGIGDFAGVYSGTNGVYLALDDVSANPPPPLTFAAGPNPGAIAVGDFNGDGWTDIVVVNNLGSNSPTLSVLRNDGIW